MDKNEETDASGAPELPPSDETQVEETGQGESHDDSNTDDSAGNDVDFSDADAWPSEGDAGSGLGADSGLDGGLDIADLGSFEPDDYEPVNTEPASEPLGQAEPVSEPADEHSTSGSYAYAPPAGPQVGSPSPPPPHRALRRDPNGPGAGVASGIARYFNIEPIIVQGLFVLFTFAAASGILLYIALWLLIPAADTNRKPGVIGVILGVGLIIGGASAGFSVIDIGFGDSFLFWFALIGVGAYLLNQRSDEVAGLGAVVHDIVTPNPVPTPAAAGATYTPASAHSQRTANVPSLGSQAVAPSTDWAIPRTDPTYQPHTPPEPKKPGPPVTLATIAAGGISVGLLVLVYQIAGWSIGAGLVLGLLLTVCGIGIVASAFIGRAPGLIPIALILALGVSVASIDNIAGVSLASGIGERSHVVAEPSQLKDKYELGIGELVLNLSALELEEDMRTKVNVGIGSVVVLVPTGMKVEIEGDASLGSVVIFGTDQEGGGISMSKEYTPEGASPNAPVLVLDLDIRIGEIEVVHGR